MARNKHPFPYLSRELVEELERRFPDKLPPIDTPQREIDCRIGNVEVVRFIRRKFEEQENNPLE